MSTSISDYKKQHAFDDHLLSYGSQLAYKIFGSEGYSVQNERVVLTSSSRSLPTLECMPETMAEEMAAAWKHILENDWQQDAKSANAASQAATRWTEPARTHVQRSLEDIQCYTAIVEQASSVFEDNDLFRNSAAKMDTDGAVKQVEAQYSQTRWMSAFYECILHVYKLEDMLSQQSEASWDKRISQVGQLSLAIVLLRSASGSNQSKPASHITAGTEAGARASLNASLQHLRRSREYPTDDNARRHIEKLEKTSRSS